MLNIKVYYDNVKYRLRGIKKIIRLIEKVIRKEKRLSGDLTFILTTDNKLLEINKEFLKHNYFTDVISFNYEKGKRLKGEVYISIDAVRRNANNYKVSLRNELLRVFIHGVLHICGYEDNNKEKRLLMKEREDHWMKGMK